MKELKSFKYRLLEAYLETFQLFIMKRFTKIVND